MTPCGPPVLRAGCGTLLVLASWLLGRPARHLNILAATLFIVLLARPGDLFDAGFQLSFAATAGLILAGTRVPRVIFGGFIDTQATLARMKGTRAANLRLRVLRFACGLLSANLIGSVMSAPLVAYHFHQFNALAMFTGVLVLPMIAAVIVVSVAQCWLGLVAASPWRMAGAGGDMGDSGDGGPGENTGGITGGVDRGARSAGVAGVGGVRRGDGVGIAALAGMAAGDGGGDVCGGSGSHRRLVCGHATPRHAPDLVTRGGQWQLHRAGDAGGKVRNS